MGRMTRKQWLATDDRKALVHHLCCKRAARTDPVWKAVLDRKLQLHGVACMRRVARYLTDRGRAALALAERMADEEVPPAERKAALKDLGDGSLDPERGIGDPEAMYSADERVEHATAGVMFLVHISDWAFDAIVRGPMSADQALTVTELEAAGRDGWAALARSRAARRRAESSRRAEQAVQAALVRDIFGNPFRPVIFNPAWRTSTVLALAQGIYDSRDFSPMPILADALQDAGCENADILKHCRDANATHVRGCWVVDLVLGKS
jgi:hypothetical protein